MKTKDKILLTSIEMFNKNGVVAVTTNHIAKELNISPGNLYFHFSNKEEIIRHLFKMMMTETYALWKTTGARRLYHPIEQIEKNFELFWKYRFFHREMYYLRRKDAQLAKMWKAHIEKSVRMTALMYRRWIKRGWMKPIKTNEEIEFLVNTLLSTASSFLQFFESSDRAPSKKHIEDGKKYVIRLLTHYAEGEVLQDFTDFVNGSEKTKQHEATLGTSKGN